MARAGASLPGPISIQDDISAASAAPARGDAPQTAVVIEVRGIDKTFRIPRHRIDSFKERAAHPLTRIEYRELRALRDVSFDVHEGEFFGIVGRNGSGKSTLLKILGSIYQPSSGRIRMAGRLAPFIELGVGFNPDLTARDNVVLNGVMMGLSRREASRRLDAVVEFAELQDFAELALKNYSSGMMVRLAFAVMVQADPDIMLIDEVLAVGDASFAQKCMDVFREKRRAGKTIVLVTHDMATVQEFCHRAMLLHDGEIRYIGDPEEAALRYFRLNFGGTGSDGDGRQQGAVPDVNARVVDTWLESRSGERVGNVEQGEPIRLNAVIEAHQNLSAPVIGFHFLTADGVQVFGFDQPLTTGPDRDRIAAGEQVRVVASIENPLVPGRYSVRCLVSRDHRSEVAVQILHLLDFVVYGTRPAPGVVSVRADVDVVSEPPR